VSREFIHADVLRGRKAMIFVYRSKIIMYYIT
jgi:hypothetical protein